MNRINRWINEWLDHLLNPETKGGVRIWRKDNHDIKYHGLLHKKFMTYKKHKWGNND